METGPTENSLIRHLEMAEQAKGRCQGTRKWASKKLQSQFVIWPWLHLLWCAVVKPHKDTLFYGYLCTICGHSKKTKTACIKNNLYTVQQRYFGSQKVPGFRDSGIRGGGGECRSLIYTHHNYSIQLKYAAWQAGENLIMQLLKPFSFQSATGCQDSFRSGTFNLMAHLCICSCFSHSTKQRNRPCTR